MKLPGEEKHQDMGDHGGHGHDHVDKDGHHHNHHHGHGGHGHHHLTDKELNWRCRLFVTLEEPDFRCVSGSVLVGGGFV